MTNRELQTLRNIGNEAEAAADEIERLSADRDSWAEQASDRAQDALNLVAAERERWAVPVVALLEAHDAGLRRLGEQMKTQGMTSLCIPAEAGAELAALEALRDLVA